MSFHGGLTRLLLLTVLLTVISPALWAAPAGLTVAASPGTVIDTPAAAHYDFGVRREGDDAPLVHVFVLRNDTAAPVILERLQTSCGCTLAVAGESGTLPLTVAPGRTVPVRIQVSLRRLLPGEIHKFVWAYTQGSVDATTMLEMRGLFQEAVSAALPPAPVKVTTISPVAAPKVGSSAPPLTSTDTQGRKFTLTARRGHPLALLFFCGCPWCADVARLWGRAQRLGTVSAGTQTVVIFDGDKRLAQEFAATNKLDLSRTTLVPDPEGRLTEGVYQVRDCPRVFALDLRGTVRYTNSHPDDQPRLAPSKAIVSRLQKSL